MDENGGFYEFKFEWEEREDEIELFDFESGPSDFSWKQRNSPLDVEDEVQEVWDLTGNSDPRTTGESNGLIRTGSDFLVRFGQPCQGLKYFL